MPVRELDRRIGSGVSVRRHTLRRWLGRGRLSDRRRSPNRSTDGSDYRLRRPPRNTAAAPHDASHASGLRSASASLRCSSRARPYHRCLYSARIAIGLIYEELSSRKKRRKSTIFSTNNNAVSTGKVICYSPCGNGISKSKTALQHTPHPAHGLAQQILRLEQAEPHVVHAHCAEACAWQGGDSGAFQQQVGELLTVQSFRRMHPCVDAAVRIEYVEPELAQPTPLPQSFDAMHNVPPTHAHNSGRIPMRPLRRPAHCR